LIRSPLLISSSSSMNVVTNLDVVSVSSQNVLSRTVSPALSIRDTPLLHDEEFYLHDDMAIFHVDHCLFKVHRYFLERESEIFRWMFLCPPLEPIPLPGVKRQEFKALMNYFYNGMHDDFRPSLDEWISILSIASRFDMDRVRQRAIRQIISHRPRIDPINKIVLAEKHDISHWLAPAYASICQRTNPLEEWEAEKLGLNIAIKLARAREALRELYSGSHLPAAHPDSIEVISEDEPEYEPYNILTVNSIVDEVFFPVHRDS